VFVDCGRLQPDRYFKGEQTDLLLHCTEAKIDFLLFLPGTMLNCVAVTLFMTHSYFFTFGLYPMCSMWSNCGQNKCTGFWTQLRVCSSFADSLVILLFQWNVGEETCFNEMENC